MCSHKIKILTEIEVVHSFVDVEREQPFPIIKGADWTPLTVDLPTYRFTVQYLPPLLICHDFYVEHSTRYANIP